MENRNNNPIAEEIIHNNPTGYGLFAGIGDNFNSAAQAICELADDAISNLRANSDDPDLSMTIVVSFENLGDAVEIGVVDGGTGITNLDSALTIACRDGAQTPLNEHGFGLKHALASCDSSPSQQWSIRTRTKKDAAANQYREVTAPYSMGTSEEDQPMKVFFYPGAGGLPYPTGTAVTVRCPMAKFQTVKPDRKAAQSDFHHLVMYAIEELRYIYAGVLADTNITMKVLEVNGGTEKCHILKPLQPTWEEGTMKRLENVPYDLGGGQLTIHCRYGNILPTKSNTLKDGAKISGAGATDVTAASYTFNFTAGNILTVANDTESRTYNAQLAVEGQSVIVQRDPTTGIRNYDVDLTEVINSTYYSDTTIKNKVDEIVTAWNAYIAEPHTFDAGTSVMAVLQDFDEWATENEDPETRESYFTGTSDFGGGSYLSKLNNLNWNDCGSMGGYMYTNDANGLYNANIEGLNTRTGKSSIPMVAANNMTFTSSTRIVWFFTVNYSNWF